MKRIKIAELKNRLSHYSSRGLAGPPAAGGE